MTRVFLIALIVLALQPAAQSAQTLTYADLVGRLTDLEALSVLPEPGERCAQCSSYDRASVYDDTTGKYVKWEANGDGRGIIRTEGDQSVLAEMEGPGCIWRIWSAAPEDGHVRIYLDGAAEPAVDLPFKAYFNHTEPPFTYPSLVHDAASGQNNYIPIPYQKSCKITADAKWGNYYHFTYATFPNGTTVPTFTRDLSSGDRLALAKANLILTRQLGSDPAGARPGLACNTSKTDFTIGPGMSRSIGSVKGTMAVTSIKVRIDPAELKKAPDMLRELVLEIRWDGEAEPSVWCPLGDFFGTAPGWNNYKSLPLGMTEDGFYSYWYMPFEKGAELRIVNQGKQGSRVKTEVTFCELARNIKTLGRFHAKWHRDAFLPSEPERWIDWPILKTDGRGRFCGVVLNVYNPKGGWWGEGDEKFFVDGEKFPSTFGTGSEDYFGYAWGQPGLFQNAYHNQTFNHTDNKGNISVNRWHITDNVPFMASFEADIEKYFTNNRPTLYSAVSYWYQTAGQSDPYKPVPLAERVGYYGD
jgi:hypothetical protein